MKQTTLHRKARITYLNLRIAVLRLAMDLEIGVTQKWRALAQRQAVFAQERNELLIAQSLEKQGRAR